MKKPKQQEKPPYGDCYQAAGRAILGLLPQVPMVRDTILCHGTVYGSKIGFHGHAWIEIGDIVFDYSNGQQIATRKEEYYKAGRVRNVARYTLEQVREQVRVHKTWGPWKEEHDLGRTQGRDGSRRSRASTRRNRR